MTDLYILEGTCASGKTTLFEALREVYPKARFVTETAREYYTKNKRGPDSHGLATQKAIQDLAKWRINEAIDLQSIVGKVIADASPLAAAAYASLSSEWEANFLLGRCSEWIEANEPRFFLLDPLPLEDTADDIRVETLRERRDVHIALESALLWLDMDYTIVSGTLEERLATVRGVIGP